MKKTARLRLLTISGIGCAALLSLAACSSSSPAASSAPAPAASSAPAPAASSAPAPAASSAASSAGPSALAAKVTQLEAPPTKIPSASLGAFTPKPHATIAIITCEQSNSSCAGFVQQSKAAAAVLGYTTTVCDAGTSAQAPAQCFT